MARSGLLDLLPDFSEHTPTQLRQDPPGFEPLVHAALSKEDFAVLDMPVGFTGMAADAEPDSGPDPFADIDGGETDGFADIVGLAAEDDAGFPDLNGDLADLSADMIAADPEPGPPPVPLLEDEADLAIPEAPEDLDTGAADAIAAQDALEAAHREEMEGLQETHREELDSLLKQAIPKAKQEIADALAADIAALLTSRLRAGCVETTIEAMTRKVTEVLDDASAVSFDLRGPEHLISAFLDTWSGDKAQIRAIPGEGVDLVARIDRTVIATRLSEFDRLIEEATA